MGITNVVAITRVQTKNLNGFVPDTSIASICSVTRIEPNSAPMLEPTLPEAISAVTSGANARMMAMDDSDGSQELAPNVANEGRDCLVNIKPTMKPVTLIRGSERNPVS